LDVVEGGVLVERELTMGDVNVRSVQISIEGFGEFGAEFEIGELQCQRRDTNLRFMN
jgi:hypothetical protein